MVHVLDASLCGYQRIMIRTNDTDVVVLAVSIANIIQADELCVGYGSGKHLRNIPVHTIAATLGPEKASVLPLFHALTGPDMVSFFGGRGKKTVWDVWNVFPQLTPVLRTLTSVPNDIDNECMVVIEKFVILMYDQGKSVLQEIQSSWQHPSYKRSCDAAHQAFCAARKLRLGANSSEAARSSMSFRMGMATWWKIGDSEVDNTPSGKGYVLWTYPLWPQECMQANLACTTVLVQLWW